MTDRRPAIDLAQNLFRREKGQLALYATWLYNEDQDNHEPALVIVNAANPRKFKPCVVALSAAYKYNDPVYLAHVSKEFVHLLGLEDNMHMAYEVALFIEDSLGDLLTMPPLPTDKVVAADGYIGSGLARKGFEILDYVPKDLS